MSTLLKLDEYEKCDTKLKKHKLEGIYAVVGFIGNYRHILPSDMMQLIFQFYFIHNDYIQPLLRDISYIKDEKELILTKLSFCSHPLVITVESLSNDKYKQAIETKTTYLKEILESLSSSIFNSSEDLQEVINVICNHIYRKVLPPMPFSNISISESVSNSSSEITQKETESEWIHLQYIYRLLSKLTSTEFDKRTVKRLLAIQDGALIRYLIELFATPSEKEREVIKQTLHAIYIRFMSFRSFIRKHFNHYLLSVIYEENPPCHSFGEIYGEYYPQNIYKYQGVNDILGTYNWICNGFATPLMQRHKDLITNIFIPLHKCRKLHVFHLELKEISVIFSRKDHECAHYILIGLLKYWPVTDSKKQVLFLEEIWEILEAVTDVIEPYYFKLDKRILSLIIDKLIECLVGYHLECMETVLQILDEDWMREIIEVDKEMFWTTIISGLLRVQRHWSKSKLVNKVLSKYKDADNDLYDKILINGSVI